ncbi:MAG: hypothetical protein QNI91_13910 [Arenicellales bacterium]|nr:hypothetical protein [Arenicellales bacterium]
MWNFSSDAIQAQLERILASPEFVNAPKLGQFLRYVVGQTLSGHPDRIKQYTIAMEGLGYGKGFDPTTNTIVRILAGRLRRALEQYYVSHGSADPIRIRIPKGRYIPTFIDNVSPTATIDGSENTPTVPEKSPPEFAQPTVAIFEFDNLGDKASDALIATGLSGEILVALTRFSELTILGPLVRTKGQPIDYQKLGREYGATFALRGWTRSYGSIIRITTDLIEVRTGGSPWGRTFEFDLDKTSLFEIEDEVTSKVVGVIADGLGVIFRKLQSESYQEHIKLNDVTLAVLAYNNAWARHTRQDWEQANTAVSQAQALHPDNALLVALQSNIYYADVLHGLDIEPDALSKMEGMALKAVALDPNLQIAQYNLVVQNAFFGRVDQCVEVAQKVVRMNPNHARILAGCAVATTSVGAYELGLELIERAKQLNPNYPGWYFFINYVVAFNNAQYEQAWSHAQLIYVGDLLWEPIFRAAVLGKLGRADEAKPFIDELLRIKPDFRQRPHEYIRRLFVTDDHVDMIWDGLLKAGIKDWIQLHPPSHQ